MHEGPDSLLERGTRAGVVWIVAVRFSAFPNFKNISGMTQFMFLKSMPWAGGLGCSCGTPGNSPLGSARMPRPTEPYVPRPCSTLPQGAPTSDLSGQSSGCRFKSCGACSKCVWFQQHVGHDRKYGFRQHVLKMGSEDQRNRLRNSLVGSPGTPCATEPCAPPLVAQCPGDWNRALDRGSFRKIHNMVADLSISTKILGRTTIMGSENMSSRRFGNSPGTF